MRALVCDNGLRLDPAYPDPVLPAGEALIRLRLGGICNTDLELVRGYASFRGVLGHEFVGEVIQASDSVWLGRRVVGDINAACYDCPACRAGRHTHCPHRTTLGIAGRDGALADQFCLPLANLYAVPDSVPDEMAVFAEPLAAACEILEQVILHPTDRVVVLGDGKLGLLVAAVLHLTGAELTLVGRHPAKLAHAQAWGVQVTLDDAGEQLDRLHDAASAGSLSAWVPVPQPGSVDLVVECTGSPAGFAAACALVRPRGTIVLKSTYHGDLTINMSALVVDEVTVVGSRCGPFAPALRLLEQGLIDPRPMIAACYNLAEAEAAMAHAAHPGVLKVLLKP